MCNDFFQQYFETNVCIDFITVSETNVCIDFPK